MGVAAAGSWGEKVLGHTDENDKQITLGFKSAFLVGCKLSPANGKK